MTTHELKIWPQWFNAVMTGAMPFQVRRDDRGYEVGDVLVLQEFRVGVGEYTGRSLRRVVTYVERGDDAPIHVMPGCCVLGIGPEERAEIPETLADRFYREKLPDGEYAILELFGHTTLVGRCAEVERFGAKMLRIEVMFRGKLLDPVFHGGSAIYRYTPCSKETAEAHCHEHEYQVPSPIRTTIPAALLTPPETPSFDGAAEDDGTAA